MVWRLRSVEGDCSVPASLWVITILVIMARVLDTVIR